MTPRQPQCTAMLDLKSCMRCQPSESRGPHTLFAQAASTVPPPAGLAHYISKQPKPIHSSIHAPATRTSTCTYFNLSYVSGGRGAAGYAPHVCRGQCRCSSVCARPAKREDSPGAAVATLTPNCHCRLCAARMSGRRRDRICSKITPLAFKARAIVYFDGRRRAARQDTVHQSRSGRLR